MKPTFRRWAYVMERELGSENARNKKAYVVEK